MLASGMLGSRENWMLSPSLGRPEFLYVHFWTLGWDLGTPLGFKTEKRIQASEMAHRARESVIQA